MKRIIATVLFSMVAVSAAQANFGNGQYSPPDRSIYLCADEEVSFEGSPAGETATLKVNGEEVKMECAQEKVYDYANYKRNVQARVTNICDGQYSNGSIVVFMTNAMGNQQAMIFNTLNGDKPAARVNCELAPQKRPSRF